MAHALVVAFFVAVLLTLSIVDIRTRRLPNRIVLPAAVLVLAANIALTPDRTLEWVTAAFGAAAVLLVASLLYPNGLGMGDVKLALLLGAALGWSVVGALAIGFMAAALAGLLLIVLRGWSARKSTIPLGPFLALGSFAVLLFSI
jgi:leader peptidase (prepilin peptidase) / N-methyltransferase